MSQRESVIVIGAGVAGLSCASELARQGLEVVVLESRRRIGGRVFSDDRLGFPVDMGASWIEGHRSNPLTKLARAAGGQTVPTDYENVAVFHQGRRVDDKELERLADESEGLLAEIAQGAGSLSADISLAAAIEQALAGQTLSAADRRGRDFVLSLLSLETAADLDDLGLTGAEEDKGFTGEHALVKGGYGLVPQYLARGLDVRTEHVVTRVQHGAAGVVVDTNQGRFEAARCVVSLPLGVLQSGQVSFAPVLPLDKQAVIRRLHMGTLDKVALVLPRRIFPGDVEFIGRMGDEPGRFPIFLDLEPLSGQPTIVGFIAGKLARALERKTDGEIVGAAMLSLRDMLGSGIPEPTQAAVVRWSADPFAGGSYSYVPVGALEADRDILAAPVGERLYFCGEATMRNYSATVHGAYLSGLRAAAYLTGAAQPPIAAGERRRSRGSNLAPIPFR